MSALESTSHQPDILCNRYQGLTLKRHIEATLGSGNIREAVRLPPGEDLCEWLAVNTVDFYNAISVLFGTLEEVCTVQSCSLMTAGPKVGRAPAAGLCSPTIQNICAWVLHTLYIQSHASLRQSAEASKWNSSP